MTAAPSRRHHPKVEDLERRVDLIDVLKLRAWARAYLWHTGEYSLHEAVDVLQHDAKRDGLTRRIGQDAVQQIIADAFAPFGELLDPIAMGVEAFKYVLRQNDPERLRAWLASRSPEEQATFTKMLATK